MPSRTRSTYLTLVTSRAITATTITASISIRPPSMTQKIASPRKKSLTECRLSTRMSPVTQSAKSTRRTTVSAVMLGTRGVSKARSSPADPVRSPSGSASFATSPATSFAGSAVTSAPPAPAAAPLVSGLASASCSGSSPGSIFFSSSGMGCLRGASLRESAQVQGYFSRGRAFLQGRRRALQGRILVDEYTAEPADCPRAQPVAGGDVEERLVRVELQAP